VRRAIEIVFTRGATEGINMVAQSWCGGMNLKARRPHILLSARTSQQYRAVAAAARNGSGGRSTSCR
jgi:selenocysteine lyase/cysteine desulfurase